MNLSDIIVVLSRPSESGNVGAVCRAMKNMGLDRLRIVAPEVPLDPDVVRARAVHAVDVFESAANFDELETALRDCAVVVGTTRRRGKRRKDISVPPDELAHALAARPGPAAIVFGNERTGLEAEELALCHLAAHIPASEEFPSLNLSHAVQIFAYEFFKVFSRESPKTAPRWVPIDAAEAERLAEITAESLRAIGFYKQAGREDQERFFRDLFARAGMTIAESRYWEKIFRKAERLACENPHG